MVNASPGIALPRMSTQARAESITVERLLRLVSEGRIRIPGFQRPFRWERSDRCALLDSIYRGYPVGTLLLWKNPPTLGTTRSIDPTAPSQAHGDTFLVIDGQQRITSLWDALGRTPQPDERRIVFDLHHDEFVYRAATKEEAQGLPPSVDGGQLPSVPMHFVLDAASLSEWVPSSLTRESKRVYFELGKRIREYRLAVYEIEDADLSTLRHVFDRVNTKGKPMTRDEVFDALIGSQVVTDEGAGLEIVNSRIEDLKFGKIARTTILKTVEAIQGTKIGTLDPREISVQKAESSLLRSAQALRSVIQFYRRIGVPHFEVCPYELPTVAIAKFFSYFQKPDERNLILLRRWFWRSAIEERLRSGSGSIQEHVDDVKIGDEHESVQRLLQRSGSPVGVDISADFLSNFSLLGARGQLILCVLLNKHPRDLVTGERLDLEVLFRDGKAGLLKPILAAPPDEMVGSLANKLLVPSGAGGARRLILACSDEGALASHGISIESVEALRQNDTRRFLTMRSAVLSRWIHAFLDKQMELARDDSPPLMALARRSA